MEYSCDNVDLQRALFTDLKDPRFKVIIVDFDNTLMLGNSTELFIDNATPRGVAWFLSMIGKWCARLLLNKGQHYNDWSDFFRVVFVCFGMPWSYFLWIKRAKQISEQRLNWPLYDRLQQRRDASVIIASFGFKQIISALIPKSGQHFNLVATSLTPPFRNVRAQTKVSAITQLKIPFYNSLAISDSLEDTHLLRVASKGHLVEWPVEEPNSPAYFPMRYLVQGKFNRSYFLWQHLGQDLAVVLLAYYTGFQNIPLLILLFGSLLTVYEIGYYENDFHVSEAEATRRVQPGSEQFKKYSIHTSAILWTFGILFFMGLFYSFRYASLWLALLVVIRGIFYVYNRISTAFRIPFYVLLQGCKYFGYCLFFKPCVLGILLLVSQAMRMIIPYLVYRIQGTLNPFKYQQLRATAFIGLFLMCLVFIRERLTHEIFAPQGLAIMLWLTYKVVDERYERCFKIISGLSRNVLDCLTRAMDRTGK